MRTTLRLFGFSALILAGVLIASPVLTLLIPSCPEPPQYFYATGVGSGLVAVFVFAALEWANRES